jgi:hypothetical protein
MICLVLTVGCSSDTDNQDTAENNRQAQIDKLRTLPYVGGTKAKASDPTGVTMFDRQRSQQGYNLYSIQDLCMAKLIDAEGNVINSWSYSEPGRWEHSELLPNGDLLVVGALGSVRDLSGPRDPTFDDGRYLLRFDWSGALLWKKHFNTHHDIEMTPSGDFLLMSFEWRSGGHRGNSVRADQLLLLDQNGTLKTTYSLLDAIRKEGSGFELNRVEPKKTRKRSTIDLLHSNSVEWMVDPALAERHDLYDLNHILVCFRHQDRVAVFDWDTETVVWSWGQGELSGPHDAHTLANGNILIFDNGLQSFRSRIVEVDPMTDTIVWQYVADPPRSFYTQSKGSVQRLPNGNTLISESNKGHGFEITPEGEVVWDYISPNMLNKKNRAAIVRMTRFPESFVEAILKAHSQ